MLLWYVAYIGLALVLVLRGFLPMWAMWRATDPGFEAVQANADAGEGWAPSDQAALTKAGFSDAGAWRITAGRHVMLVHLWARQESDATIGTAIAPPGGKNPAFTFSTFLSRSVGRIETATERTRPLLPGEVMQVLPAGTPAALLAAHEQALRRLADYGVMAGPVVAIDGLQTLRHQMLIARMQMRRRPLSWMMSTLLHNVRPVRTDTIGDTHDLRPRLVDVGLLPSS